MENCTNIKESKSYCEVKKQTNKIKTHGRSSLSEKKGSKYGAEYISQTNLSHSDTIFL